MRQSVPAVRADRARDGAVGFAESPLAYRVFRYWQRRRTDPSSACAYRLLASGDHESARLQGKRLRKPPKMSTSCGTPDIDRPLSSIWTSSIRTLEPRRLRLSRISARQGPRCPCGIHVLGARAFRQGSRHRRFRAGHGRRPPYALPEPPRWITDTASGTERRADVGLDRPQNRAPPYSATRHRSTAGGVRRRFSGRSVGISRQMASRASRTS